MGVIGTGKIGRVFARIMRGFGCELIGYDKFPSPDFEALNGRYVPLRELAALSDIVSLHCPLTRDTHYLVDADALALAKPGAMLINTSRGGLVDTEAAIAALKSGQLGALGIDVYEQETDLFFQDRSSSIIPDDVIQRLVSFPNVIVTGTWLSPHRRSPPGRRSARSARQPLPASRTTRRSAARARGSRRRLNSAARRKAARHRRGVAVRRRRAHDTSRGPGPLPPESSATQRTGMIEIAVGRVLSMEKIMGMRLQLRALLFLTGVALTLACTSVRAQEIPLVTGAIWTASSEPVKKAYLVGIANTIQVETAYAGTNPPSDGQSIVPRAARGMRGQTLDGVREALDKWYAANPDKLQRPVIETIWFEMVVPGLAKNK